MDKLKCVKRMKCVLIVVHFSIPLVVLLIFAAFLITTSSDQDNAPKHQSGIGLSEEVQKYAAEVYRYAELYDIRDYGNYLLAIMQVETRGTGVDVMQSLAHSGLKEEEKTPGISIEYGCRYFASLVHQAKESGCDVKTAIQAYNYGNSYISYVSSRGKEHSYTLAVDFAASKSGGKKVIYNNEMAVRTNGGWRYAYGNMFYVYLVKQYLAGDSLPKETADIIINEAVKYKGYPYVWGGSNPSTSFDCSGLVQWCYGIAGISMPHNAQAQYDKMQHITLEEAEPGDLVFFTGTTDGGSYITHVGIYIGDDKMFHAGNPLGYADLTSKYWKQHYVCAGRIND